VSVCRLPATVGWNKHTNSGTLGSDLTFKEYTPWDIVDTAVSAETSIDLWRREGKPDLVRREGRWPLYCVRPHGCRFPPHLPDGTVEDLPEPEKQGRAPPSILTIMWLSKVDVDRSF